MGKQSVIDTLNEIRKAELTAISQYMAHHYYIADLGYPKLSIDLKNDSFDEMKHAELLAERILDLEGDPEFGPLKAPHKKGTVEEMLQADCDLEKDAIERLNNGIKSCSENGDATSRQLLEDITKAEELHLNDIKQHLKHIKTFGNDYLIQFAEVLKPEQAV